MRRLIEILAVSCLLIFTAGCWERLEIEEQAYVVVIGVDVSKEMGYIDVTLQIANPQVGSTDRSQADKEPSSDTIRITVPDLISAKDTANAVITRRISFAHLKTLIIGNELAKTTQLDRIVSSIIRDRQVRREVNLMVSDGTAHELVLKNKPKLETRPHKYYEFMQKRWKETGMVPFSTFNSYFERSEGKNSIFLAIYASARKSEGTVDGHEDEYIAGQVMVEGGDPIQLIGSAVIKGGKMIDVITGEETRICLLLRKNFEADHWQATYKDPLDDRYRVTARLLKVKDSRIELELSKDPMEIHVTVPVTLQLMSVPSQIDYVENMSHQQILIDSIEEGLRSKSMAFIKKTQEQYSDDPFLWSLEARKKFWKTESFYDYHWDEKYRHAKISVDYHVIMEDFGKTLRPPETIKKGVGTQ